LGIVNQAAAVNTFGATISTTATVAAGQSYYIKVLGSGGPGSVGSYGLLVNFGNQYQAPIPPPNTVVAAQPDQGVGVVANVALDLPAAPNGSLSPAQRITLGTLTGWVSSMSVRSSSRVTPAGPAVGSPNSGPSWTNPGGPTSTALDASAWLPADLAGASAPQAVPPPPIAAGPLPSVLQALDTVLSSWTSQDQPGSILAVDSTSD
jgi:hypothetical protein